MHPTSLRLAGAALLASALVFVATSATPVVAQSRSESRAAAHPGGTSRAATPPPHRASGGPKAIGRFDDWTAATNLESGALTCYAFTRVQSSQPVMPGRGDVVLTVTERATPRDAVAISAGFSFPQGATVAVGVESVNFDFYTAQRSAFARDGRAVVAAFHKGSKTVAKVPGPRNTAISDTFSLRGFSAAYAAIQKACPAK